MVQMQHDTQFYAFERVFLGAPKEREIYAVSDYLELLQ
jgi:hypothetical protein